MIDTTAGFTLVRDFDASPEELWRCWTHPAEATHWLHPRGVHTPQESIRIDAREGGTYEYVMVSDSTGDRFPTAGVFREVEPHRRLSFTWGDPGDDPDDCPLITVTFEPVGSRTRMTFDLRGVPAGPGDDIHDGWEEAIDLLVGHLDRPEGG